MPKIIGLGLATEMILTGKMIKANEAHKIGLVNHIFPKEELIEKTINIAKSFNSKSPESLCAAIKSINNSFTKEGDSLESQEFSKLFKTTNFKEGVSAFLEREILFLINECNKKAFGQTIIYGFSSVLARILNFTSSTLYYFIFTPQSMRLFQKCMHMQHSLWFWVHLEWRQLFFDLCRLKKSKKIQRLSAQHSFLSCLMDFY